MVGVHLPEQVDDAVEVRLESLAEDVEGESLRARPVEAVDLVEPLRQLEHARAVPLADAPLHLCRTRVARQLLGRRRWPPGTDLGLNLGRRRVAVGWRVAPPIGCRVPFQLRLLSGCSIGCIAPALDRGSTLSGT